MGDVKMIKNERGVLLTDDNLIADRWKEYFQQLLNTENPRDALPESKLVEGPEQRIEVREVEAALKKMKCGKDSGPTGVTSEMLKALGDIGIAHLTELVNCIFLSESIPADWRNSILVPIFKQKGDPMECGNYRAIKLMEHTMKLCERILDARLRKVISIDEMQFGFMPGKSTIDLIFILRQTGKCTGGEQAKLCCVHRFGESVR